MNEAHVFEIHSNVTEEVVIEGSEEGATSLLNYNLEAVIDLAAGRPSVLDSAGIAARVVTGDLEVRHLGVWAGQRDLDEIAGRALIAKYELHILVDRDEVCEAWHDASFQAVVIAEGDCGNRWGEKRLPACPPHTRVLAESSETMDNFLDRLDEVGAWPAVGTAFGSAELIRHGSAWGVSEHARECLHTLPEQAGCTLPSRAVHDASCGVRAVIGDNRLWCPECAEVTFARVATVDMSAVGRLDHSGRPVTALHVGRGESSPFGECARCGRALS
jgi:hypothetical protein